MSGSILKSGALAVGLIAASSAVAQASQLAFGNNVCLFASSCDLTITGPGGGNGAIATLSASTGVFSFFKNAHGLGIGYHHSRLGVDPNVTFINEFPESITFSVDRDLTWVGGAFAAVETIDGTTPAVAISGTGVMTSVFTDEDDFNTADEDGSLSNVSRDYETFVSFLAGEDYTFTFSDFALAGEDNDAFVQLRSMEFVSTASIPLPATAWMMISALGFLGWRKYRAA